MGADEAELIAWLTAQSERVVDTACAHVFLAGGTAFKLKRHADLGYADFTTPAKRLWALERELAFNKDAAPDIYRRLLRITREAGGGFAFEGAGETVDYALEMRRFADDAVLAARPQDVDGELAEALGRTIARLHAAADPRPESGFRSLEFTVGSNTKLLRELGDRLDPARVETLAAMTEAELSRQEPLLRARAVAGFARRCHGDLHLGNILVEDGKPVLFDCIEFNDLLSDLDVQYDLAFLLMDLDFRGRRDAGVRALSAYLDEAARSFPQTIWEGLAALPLMLSVRAGVRAHVQAHGGDLAGAAAYVEAAIAHLSPARPVLAAVGGPSGSGKSTFARGIAPALGASPGAVVLRTDEIRKRLLGVAPTEPVSRDLYTPEFYQRTYDALFGDARALLDAGRAVVLDATFIDEPLRARAERLAADCGVPFHGLFLEAPTAVLEARVAARTGDASDATVEVLHDQLARLTGGVSWRRIDASGDLVEAARHAL